MAERKRVGKAGWLCKLRRGAKRRLIVAAIVGHLAQAAIMASGALTIERVIDGFGAVTLALLHITESEKDVVETIRAEIARAKEEV